MDELPREYTTLFNAITDAVNQLAELDASNQLLQIRENLISAQLQAEEFYISRSPNQ